MWGNVGRGRGWGLEAGGDNISSPTHCRKQTDCHAPSPLQVEQLLLRDLSPGLLDMVRRLSAEKEALQRDFTSRVRTNFPTTEALPSLTFQTIMAHTHSLSTFLSPQYFLPSPPFVSLLFSTFNPHLLYTSRRLQHLRFPAQPQSFGFPTFCCTLHSTIELRPHSPLLLLKSSSAPPFPNLCLLSSHPLLGMPFVITLLLFAEQGAHFAA
jgi:hypothetical protein